MSKTNTEGSKEVISSQKPEHIQIQPEKEKFNKDIVDIDMTIELEENVTKFPQNKMKNSPTKKEESDQKENEISLKEAIKVNDDPDTTDRQSILKNII